MRRTHHIPHIGRWRAIVVVTDQTVIVDLTVYDLDVVQKAAYAIGERCSAGVHRLDETRARVTLRPLSNRTAGDDLVAALERQLVDYRIRAQLTKETATIRDLIFRQAFVEADL